VEVKVDFYYPDLEFISDRTFRESLKLASRTIHQIHLGEIDHLIATSELANRAKQSLRDRLRGKTDHLPNYYVESVNRGSLEIAVTLTGFGIWLLQSTIGETVKEAWTRTQFHRHLARFLANSTAADDQPPKSLPASSSVKNLLGNGERWQRLDRQFSETFAVHKEFGRFQITQLDISPDYGGDMHVRVQLGLAEEYVELEGTFKQILYRDVISKLLPKAKSRKVKKAPKKRRSK
jgi:hypothetical protein